MLKPGVLCSESLWSTLLAVLWVETGLGCHRGFYCGIGWIKPGKKSLKGFEGGCGCWYVGFESRIIWSIICYCCRNRYFRSSASRWSLSRCLLSRDLSLSSCYFRSSSFWRKNSSSRCFASSFCFFNSASTFSFASLANYASFSLSALSFCSFAFCSALIFSISY